MGNKESNNLSLYERARSVPQEAIKPIQAGRLKGKSDINPMWRIKKLTEEFGPCGFGWKYDILRMWLEPGANGEVSAFVHISLYVKMDGEWSEAIQGVGGSAFISNERNGAYTNDECYKMALTDAISVACKSLGFAADVYFSADRTKYDISQQQSQQQPSPDTRKVLPQELLNDAKVMLWLYKKEEEARKSGRRTSLKNLLETSYRNTTEEIQTILENYERYKINNNLQ